MKRLFLLAAAVCLLAACDKNDDAMPKGDFEVISFEPSEGMTDLVANEALTLKDVTMNLYDIGNYTYQRVFCGKDYVSASNRTDFDGPLFATAGGGVKFSSYYSAQYDTWGGIALAQSADRKAAAMSYTQQFSVWAEGGANGTRTYAVFYDSNTPSEGYMPLTESGYPTVTLMQPRVVDHLYIANSTLVYNYFQGTEEDLFQVEITGWNDGRETGSVTQTLVSGTSKLSTWRKVSLATLGAVDKLVFKVTGIDVAADPTYFCIDEIALRR